MIDKHQAEGNAPEHKGPTTSSARLTQPIESRRQGQLQQQKVAVQPAVVGNLLQVGGELAHILLGWHGVQHPGEVAPPEAEMTVVVVSWIVGVQMVMAMQAHPVDRTVLAAEGTAGSDNQLQPPGHLKSSVGQQTVITQGHPHTGGEPVQPQKDQQCCWAPEAWQQSDQRQGMDRHHEQQRSGAERQASRHNLHPLLKGGQGSGRPHAIAPEDGTIGWLNWRNSKPAKRAFRPRDFSNRAGLAGSSALDLIARNTSTS